MNKKFLSAITAVLTAALVSFSSIAVFAADGDDGPAVLPGDIVKVENEDNGAGDEVVTPPSLQKKAGDVDGNGVVDINDVTVYQLTLAGRTSVTEAFNLNAETVTDNKFNITDATGIQFYVAGAFKKLPVTPDGYYAEIIRP